LLSRPSFELLSTYDGETLAPSFGGGRSACGLPVARSAQGV
jgi:hypothetical protein